MIVKDILTPCSGGDYVDRLREMVRRLERAQADLNWAWNRHNDSRWRNVGDGPIVLDKLTPHDDSEVVETARRIEEARIAWRKAHADLVSFIGPLVLRCGVRDWQRPCRGYCTMPAAHNGRHDFEPESALATTEGAS